MVSAKISTFAVLFTGTTLFLQIMILLRTQSNARQMPRYKSGDALDARLPTRTALFEKQAPKEAAAVDEFPVAKNNRKRRLTIGIPTVKRPKGRYFLTMFETMLNKTTEEQLNEIVFVIFLAEMNNITWKQEMMQYLNWKYQKHVESGSLIVFEAPLSVYASMPDYRNNPYMLWRTKQNFDYAYMMKYSQHLSEYYMQMEDDVITSDDYYTAIMDFINTQKDDNWVCMEFSELGFIGKLYHSRDSVRLADMLLTFNNTQPVDYTFIYFNMLSGQKNKLLRKPTLFQHMGVQSSLAHKVQLLKDRYFDFSEKKLKGDNPKANVFTSLANHEDFPPELAYSSKPGYFWSRMGASINDTFTVVFESPWNLTRVVIVTGGRDHPLDIIYSASVEASPSVITPNGASCSGYVPIGEFKGGVANITTETLIARMPFNAFCLNIRFTHRQRMWVIIREIAVFT